MTRIDFYILPSTATDQKSRLAFACRLVEKALKSRAKITIFNDQQQEADKLSDMLWSQRPESFIPHLVSTNTEANSGNLNAAPRINESVYISTDTQTTPFHDIAINLNKQRLTTFSQFERLIEVVNHDQSLLKRSREDYAYFKNRGYTVNTHKL